MFAYVRVFYTLAAAAIRDVTPRGTRGGRGGKGRGERSVLRQKNLEESFMRSEAVGNKRKDRSPEEAGEPSKKERAENTEEKDLPSRREGTERSQSNMEKGEEVEMEEVRKALEMATLLKEEKEERRKMMEGWERRWEMLEARIGKKVEEEVKRVEDNLKEAKEEREKDKIEWKQVIRRETEEREGDKKELLSKMEDELKGLVGRLESSLLKNLT